MSAFTDAFETGTRDLEAFSVGSCSGCEKCQKQGEYADDGVFSPLPCETCNSRLAGVRYPAHYLLAGRKIDHIEVCKSCLLYAANGDEPEDWC